MQLHGNGILQLLSHSQLGFTLRDKLSPQMQHLLWYRVNVPPALDRVRRENAVDFTQILAGEFNIPPCDVL